MTSKISWLSKLFQIDFLSINCLPTLFLPAVNSRPLWRSASLTFSLSFNKAAFITPSNKICGSLWTFDSCTPQILCSSGKQRGKSPCGFEFPSHWVDVLPPPPLTASPSITPKTTTLCWPSGWERGKAGCRGLQLTKLEWQVEIFSPKVHSCRWKVTVIT